MTDRKLLSQDEVIAQIKADTAWNRARATFASWSARIEQADAQRRKPSIFDLRAMEFEAVREIAAILGVRLPEEPPA